MIRKLKYYLAFGFLYLIPSFVYGQTGITGSAEEAGNALENITIFMRNLLLSLSVLFVIIAAYKFLTAAGDPEKIKSAKKMLAYTFAAIIIAFIATGIVPLVESIL